jgi:hypothetical protein
MNAESRPQRGTASAGGRPESIVTPTGCLCGCAGSGWHAADCPTLAPIPEVCSRRCQTLGIDELRRVGVQFGGCKCKPLPWTVAS